MGSFRFIELRFVDIPVLDLRFDIVVAFLVADDLQVSRALCSRTIDGDDIENGFRGVDDFFREKWKSSSFESNVEENTAALSDTIGSSGARGDSEDYNDQMSCAKQNFIDEVRNDAVRILEILHQDGPGFDAKPVLNDLGVRVSGLLVREVLFGILKTINYANRNRCAKLGYKFFVCSNEHDNYRHTVNGYHIMMQIFSESEEFKAMWRLVDEMIEKGYPTTTRTFNILICACGEVALARQIAERFIKSKTFDYRPFKHSFNAILHSLLTQNQYRLIEWVYQQMLVEGHSPDMLTYNIIVCAKFRLGKLDQFHRLLDEMGRNGFSPDFHTFNLLLRVLGKGDKAIAALKLLNHMKEVGVDPSVLHFTTLIDGLGRAGNLDACLYFVDEMMKHGCRPDVVTYTVMITGYVVAGELDKARKMFDEMFEEGQLPNVFTYNSMIRGLCMVDKFDEAWLMLKEMGSKGCNPNFLVYTTILSYLQIARKMDEAQEVVKHMVERGDYVHLLGKIKRYRRC